METETTSPPGNPFLDAVKTTQTAAPQKGAPKGNTGNPFLDATPSFPQAPLPLSTPSGAAGGPSGGSATPSGGQPAPSPALPAPAPPATPQAAPLDQPVFGQPPQQAPPQQQEPPSFNNLLLNAGLNQQREQQALEQAQPEGLLTKEAKDKLQAEYDKLMVPAANEAWTPPKRALDIQRALETDAKIRAQPAKQVDAALNTQATNVFAPQEQSLGEALPYDWQNKADIRRQTLENEALQYAEKDPHLLRYAPAKMESMKQQGVWDGADEYQYQGKVLDHAKDVVQGKLLLLQRAVQGGQMTPDQAQAQIGELQARENYINAGYAALQKEDPKGFEQHLQESIQQEADIKHALGVPGGGAAAALAYKTGAGAVSGLSTLVSPVLSAYNAVFGGDDEYTHADKALKAMSDAAGEIRSYAPSEYKKDLFEKNADGSYHVNGQVLLPGLAEGVTALIPYLALGEGGAAAGGRAAGLLGAGEEGVALGAKIGSKAGIFAPAYVDGYNNFVRSAMASDKNVDEKTVEEMAPVAAILTGILYSVNPNLESSVVNKEVTAEILDGISKKLTTKDIIANFLKKGFKGGTEQGLINFGIEASNNVANTAVNQVAGSNLTTSQTANEALNSTASAFVLGAALAYGHGNNVTEAQAKASRMVAEDPAQAMDIVRNSNLSDVAKKRAVTNIENASKDYVGNDLKRAGVSDKEAAAFLNNEARIRSLKQHIKENPPSDVVKEAGADPREAQLEELYKEQRKILGLPEPVEDAQGKPKPKTNGTVEKGKQQQNDQLEHQNGDQSGTPESPSGSDRIEQSGQVEQEVKPLVEGAVTPEATTTTDGERETGEVATPTPETDLRGEASVPGVGGEAQPVERGLTEDIADDPKALAEAYYEDHLIHNSDANPDYAIQKALEGSVNPKSYDEFGDKNKRSSGMAKFYFAKKDGRHLAKQGQGLDQIAQELTETLGREVTPSELAEFMESNPSGIPRTSPRMREMQDRHKGLTGKKLDKATGARLLKEKGRASTKDPTVQEYIDGHTDQEGNVNWQSIKDEAHALAFLGYTNEQAANILAEANRNLGTTDAGGGKVLAEVSKAEGDAGQGGTEQKAQVNANDAGGNPRVENAPPEGTNTAVDNVVAGENGADASRQPGEVPEQPQGQQAVDAGRAKASQERQALQDQVDKAKADREKFKKDFTKRAETLFDKEVVATKKKAAEPSMFEAEGDTRANSTDDFKKTVKPYDDAIAKAEKDLADYDSKAGDRVKAEEAQTSIPDAVNTIDQFSKEVNENLPVPEVREASIIPSGAVKITLEKDIRDAVKELPESARETMDNVGGILKATAAHGRNLVESVTGIPKMSAYKRALNDFTGGRQVASLRIANMAKGLLKSLPSKRSRVGISNWLDMGGDETKLKAAANDTSLPLRLRNGYRRALDLTPHEKAEADRIKGFLSSMFNDAVNAGIFDGKIAEQEGWQGVQNYITHIVRRPFVGGGTSDIPSGKLASKFKYAKGRKFDTFYDLERFGMRAKTKDVAEILAVYANEMDKTIRTREFIKSLTETKEGEEPLAIPLGGNVIKGEEGGPTFITPSKSATNAEESQYKSIQHPALRGWRWIGKDGDGNPIMMKGDLGIHPDVFPHLKNVLGHSAIEDWYNRPSSPLGLVGKSLVKGLDKSVRIIKSTELGGLISTFHVIHEGKRALGNRINPFSVKAPDPSDPMVERATKASLGLAGDNDAAQMFMDGFGGKNNITEHIPIAGPIIRAWTNWQFHNYIPGLKLKTWEALVDRNTKLYSKELESGKMDQRDVDYLSAQQANARFGHLNYADLGRNPTLQHIMRLGLLAPDFLEANLRNYGQAAKGAVSKSGREPGIAFALTAGAMWLAARALNQWLDDDPHYEEPFGVIHDGRKYTMRNEAEDAWRAFSDTRTYVNGRLSPLSSFGLQSSSGTNWRGEKTDFKDALEDYLTSIVPMSAKGIPGVRDLTQTEKDRTSTILDDFASSNGLQISRNSPITEVYKLATKYRKDIGEKEDRGVYPVSKYQQLRYSLEDNDPQRASEELEKLLASDDYKGLTERGAMAKISKGFHASLNHPWTGSRAKDADFKKTLKGKDLEAFERATKLRKDIENRFGAMVYSKGSSGNSGKSSTLNLRSLMK